MTEDFKRKYIIEVYRQHGSCGDALRALQLPHAVCNECPLVEKTPSKECCPVYKAKKRAEELIKTFTPEEIVEALL